jgi:hypothetical protein
MQNCLFLKLIRVVGPFTSSSGTQILLKIEVGLRTIPKKIMSFLFQRESEVRTSEIEKCLKMKCLEILGDFRANNCEFICRLLQQTIRKRYGNDYKDSLMTARVVCRNILES